MEINIPRNKHCILQISFNFVDDILGWSSKENGTCLGIMTSCQECEVSGLATLTGGGYSSPIFSMWKRPQPTPTSDSRISSTLLTIVAPTALAIRLLSVFLTRRIAVTD